MPLEFRAMKPGSTSLVERAACDSSDTTEPTCGAIAPVAPPGLRAICAHACPSVCTAAHARPGRTRLILSRCSAVFGMSPCGKLRLPPLYVVGLKSAGVQAPTLRSHVSMFDGAPGRKMKMQFLAVFFSATFGA